MIVVSVGFNNNCEVTTYGNSPPLLFLGQLVSLFQSSYFCYLVVVWEIALVRIFFFFSVRELIPFMQVNYIS